MSDRDHAPVKRALFIVITDHPGGAERVTFNLATGLSRRPGWAIDVKIVCARLARSFSREAAPAAARIDYGWLRNQYLSFAFLPARLIGRSYDLVFTTHVYASALVSMMRRLRLLRAKRFVARESTSLFDRHPGPRRLLFAWLYRRYGGEDLLIAQTNYMASHAAARLPPRSIGHLRILPNPLDMQSVAGAARRPLDPELRDRLSGGPNILFCGRLIACKNPLLALSAFRRIADAGSTARLVVMGAGDLERDLRAEVDRSGLNERVLFLGQRLDPYPIMAACQIGMVTSTTEGFPNVVLEMMACGVRKIVVTPCAGDLDQLPGVTVTDSFDPSEIAGVIRRALERNEDWSEQYRRFAASRSVASYLDDILGLTRADEQQRAADV